MIMKTMNDEKKSAVILLTGGIGSGKSAVRRILEGMGVPCYDADSAVKGFYAVPAGADEPSSAKPFLLPKIEAALGQSFRREDGGFDNRALAAVIFNDAAMLKVVEDIVFPALAADFAAWLRNVESHIAAEQVSAEGHLPGGIAVFESATALDKPDFPKVWDKCLWVDAPEELRVMRVMARDHCTREQVLSRLHLQSPLAAHRDEIDAIILNDCSLQELSSRVRTALRSIILLSTLYK